MNPSDLFAASICKHYLFTSNGRLVRITAASSVTNTRNCPVDLIMNAPSLTDLASDIARNAATISEFLENAGHAQPSFASTGPARFPADAADEILAARTNLIHAARQLQFLALGPTEALQWFALTGVSTVITCVRLCTVQGVAT